MRRTPFVLLFLVFAYPTTVVAGQDAAAPRRESPPVAQMRDGHPSFRIGPVRLDLRARVQADLSGSETEVADIDVGRKRIGVEGEIGKALRFELDHELGDNQPWRDAFVDLRVHEAFLVRGGQFKVPFGLEATTSSANLDFVYRSQAARFLTPGRGRGVMLAGRVLKRHFWYQAAVLLDDGDNMTAKGDTAAAGGRTLAIRATAAPLAQASASVADLLLSVSTTVGTVTEGISGLRARSLSGEDFAPAAYWVSGQRRRTAFEARWEPGPLGVAGEYLRITDERKGQGVTGEDLAPLTATGWYVSAAWVITGDAKRRVARPRNPLFGGGAGAFEVAIRLEELRVGETGVAALGRVNPRDEHVPEGRSRVLTTGVNWYVNRWVKVQGDLVRETLTGAAALATGEASSVSRVVRVQFSM